jgi:hypothetical protein
MARDDSRKVRFTSEIFVFLIPFSSLLSTDDTPCDVCMLAGPQFAKACTSYSFESCSRCLETGDICFYDGVLPTEERVEFLQKLTKELDSLTSALQAMVGHCQ